MRAVGLFLLALTAAASALPANESYVVRLTRPKKVGDRYRVDVKGANKERQRVTVGGQLAGNEEKELSVHLIATATVRAVDARSNPSRIEYRIESCQMSAAGKTEEVLPAGRMVTVENKNGEAVFTSDGDRPLDSLTQEALKVVLNARAPDSPTDDDIFGTRERKRVGDKWGIDADAAARDLSKKASAVSPADVKGSVQLDRVRTVGSVKALEIVAHLRVERMNIPTPEGTKLEKATMEADLTGLVPADPQSDSFLPDKAYFQTNFSIVGEKPETGEKLTIELWMETTIENSYSPIEEAPKPKAALDQIPVTRTGMGSTPTSGINCADGQ
jgi:hypothetical protein